MKYSKVLKIFEIVIDRVAKFMIGSQRQSPNLDLGDCICDPILNLATRPIKILNVLKVVKIAKAWKVSKILKIFKVCKISKILMILRMFKS